MSNYVVLDAHCDTAAELWKRGETLDHCTTDVSLAAAGELAGYVQFFAICPLLGLNTGYSCEAFYENCLQYFRRELERLGGRAVLIRSGQELEAALQAGQLAAFLSLEGAEGISCDPGRLEEAYAQGIRMVTLTWNANNALAGCSKLDGPGLTALGREFVRRAQRLGILVDVSHISEKAFWDIMDIAEKPVVASHSNSFTLCHHNRNLTDAQFKALCETGGFAGINLFGYFLSEDGKADLDTVRCHMDHFLQLGGAGHIALGGDLDGCDLLPTGFRSVANYNDLSSHLETSGFSPETIQDIFSNTLKRVVTSCAM